MKTAIKKKTARFKFGKDIKNCTTAVLVSTYNNNLLFCKKKNIARTNIIIIPFSLFFNTHRCAFLVRAVRDKSLMMAATMTMTMYRRRKPNYSADDDPIRSPAAAFATINYTITPE